ncbi:MAG: polyprenyl synthetase family protein [Saprospiraceae bacterium]
MADIKKLQQLFLDYLEENPWNQAPSGLYEPVNYIMQLGGKRLRPVLVLLAYDLFRDDVKKALPVAMAVEIFHNFTLVHDDIMDAAPLRRGMPSVHTKYDINTGILSGDVMLIDCYEYLLKVNASQRLKQLVSIFNKVAIKVCEGQQYDIDFEKRTDVTIEEYVEMIKRKTATLIAGSLALGATTAEAPEEDIQHLSAFGENIGIAFQMQDDYLDTFGDPQKVGKKTGGDIIQNKKTFLILKAMALAAPAQRRQLETYFSGTHFDETEKVERVTLILHQLNIPKLTLQIKQQYQDEAFRHLDAIHAARPEGIATLRELSLSLIGREA